MTHCTLYTMQEAASSFLSSLRHTLRAPIFNIFLFLFFIFFWGGEFPDH